MKEKENSENSKKLLQKSDSPFAKEYALFSFFSSFFLGLVFIYLFLWKTPGVSHIIFYFITSIIVLLPAAIWDPKRIAKGIGLSWLILFLALGSSLVFVFRFNEVSWAWAIILLPILYAVAYASIYKPDLVKRFGLTSYIILPFILFVSWFVDAINFVLNSKFNVIKSPRFRSIVIRTMFGLVISFPILVVFTTLLASADYAFADFLERVFGELIRNFFTIDVFGKLLVGGIASIYFMVFNFSIWNTNSALSSFIDKYTESKVIRLKYNWDPLITGIVLNLVNVLFIVFVAVQFVYLFGGEKNINSSDSGFTYAEYARRGFSELLIVSFLVYILVYILNLKVKTVNSVQEGILRVGNSLLVLLTIIISISAHKRLGLTENWYGYTAARVNGHIIMYLIDIMLIALFVFSLWRSTISYMSKVNFVVLMLTFVLIIGFPTDYVVAKLNVSRYEDSGEIDLSYVISLSDEAIPALCDLVELDRTPEVTKTIVQAELQYRLKSINDNDHWQSFNYIAFNNKRLIEEVLDDGVKYDEEARDSLKEFLADYEAALIAGDYEKAHEEFWAENTKFNHDSEINSIQVKSLKYNDLPMFSLWNLRDISDPYLDGSREFNYWDGMYVGVDLKYSNSTTDLKYRCLRDDIWVKLENGTWKISNSYYMAIGYSDYLLQQPGSNFDFSPELDYCY